jgi:hypothetical protein
MNNCRTVIAEVTGFTMLQGGCGSWLQQRTLQLKANAFDFGTA